MMTLLDLPPEILQLIAEEIVIALGPFEAQRLRLVNKFFSHEILRATCATRIIDSLPSCDFQRMSIWIKARYLQTRTFTDPRGINEFTTVIQRTVVLLLKETQPHSDELRLKYTRVLCTAAAACLDSTRGSEVLEKLKTRSISNDYANEDVRDVFAAAAHVGNALLLEKLIDKGVDIDAESQYFGRPLRGAAFGGHRDAVLLLLNRGAEVNADSAYSTTRIVNWKSYVLPYYHSTALQAAALTGHEHIVRLLLDPNYHVSTSGNVYDRAILYAAQGGHLSLVRFLMDNAKILRPEHLYQWILFEACCYGHEPIVQMMLDLGTNLNDPFKWDDLLDGCVDKSLFRLTTSHNPLRIAASRNFHKIVQLLLAKGADPNPSEEYQDLTPLYDAVRCEHERVAQTLLDHGADINAGEHSPLTCAVKYGTLHMVRFLLERGAPLYTIGYENPLASAAHRGHEPMVRLLVKFGASVDGTDKRPNRAMLNAMMAGHDHVVKTLIELGARTIDPLQRVYADKFVSGKCSLREVEVE